jgi:VWFA-related protein
MKCIRIYPLSLAAGLVLAAQTPPAATSGNAAQATAPLKITTRLVEVNVLVHDHHGTPVGDLTKEDFEVTDEGRPQNISVFTVDRLKLAEAGAPNGPKPKIIPANVVTNRPSDIQNGPTSVTVLLLDFYNTKLSDQMSTRKQIIKFLRQIRPEDRVAVYLLKGNGFSIVHDFTNNSETLLTALAKVLPGFSAQLDASDFDAANTGDDNMDTLLDTSNTVTANFFLRVRALNTCLAFKALAMHLAGVPGRKNVVWLSSGFPIAFGFGDPQDGTDQDLMKRSAAAQDQEIFADYIEDASRAMDTANVAVYPVDARGLLGLPFADASKQIKMDPRTHQIPQNLMHVDQRNMDTMNYIADLTGGKAFYNTNDIQGAIRKAIDDSDVTYTLGYYVPDNNWDNKFHKIKVKVKRSGVSVRTKKGYFAQEASALTPTKLDDALREAVWSPLDSTMIGLTVRIDPSPALPNATRVVFAIDPNDLQFKRREDGKYAAALDVVVLQETKRGKRLADSKKTINMAATPEQYNLMSQKGLEAGEDLAVTPETEAIRVVVMDRGTGQTGSATVPLTAAYKSGPNVTPSGSTGKP